MEPTEDFEISKQAPVDQPVARRQRPDHEQHAAKQQKQTAVNGRCDVVSQDSTGVEAAFTKHEVTVLATGNLLRSWFGDDRSVLVKNSLETAVEARG